MPLTGDPAALWAAGAAAWNRWAEPMAELAERFNKPLLDAAAVSAGMRVLDLAAGAGEPALSAARRVAPDGLVVATDLVPAMLVGAERRAHRDGLELIFFAAADMSALPFADAAFGAVTCRFGLMFVPDPMAALVEARRVIRAGGRAAFLVWGPLAENTLWDAVAEALDAVTGTDPVDAARQPFRLAAPDTVAGLMRGAGFADVAETELRFTPRIAAGEKFWRPTLDLSLGPRWAAATDAQRQAIDVAVERRLERHRDGGRYRLAVHVRIGVGRA